MDIITAVAEELMNTPPSRSRRPSMSYALPPLPTFESTWDFSQFRSQSPSSPQLPGTPSRTRITSPEASVSASPTKNSEGQASPSWTASPKRLKMSCFKAPPPSPLLRPVQAMNDQAMRDVCSFASLSLSIAKSSTELSAVPGLTDSFTSSSYSSDEHHSDTDVDDDTYRTSTEKARNSYYASPNEAESENCEQSYILPSAESCYALGFGKLGCPESPSPVKNASPIRMQMRPSPTRTRIAPLPASFQARPSMSLRRPPSQKTTKSSRTITPQRFDRNNSQNTIHLTNTSTTPPHNQPQRAPSPAISLATALSTIPPPAPQTSLPLPPPPRRSFARDRHMASNGHNAPCSPPADYTPPYLSLFPMSARHSTPNGETPPWPVPTRRAPRPVTAPATQSSIALGVHASTTVLGSAGGAFIAQPVEKSVWEDDSSDDEEEERKGKWHLRTGSNSSSRGIGKDGKGSMRGKDGFKEKEKWGKRSASDVVRSLFMKHSGH